MKRPTAKRQNAAALSREAKLRQAADCGIMFSERRCRVLRQAWWQYCRRKSIPMIWVSLRRRLAVVEVDLEYAGCRFDFALMNAIKDYVLRTAVSAGRPVLASCMIRFEVPTEQLEDALCAVKQWLHTAMSTSATTGPNLCGNFHTPLIREARFR